MMEKNMTSSSNTHRACKFELAIEMNRREEMEMIVASIDRNHHQQQQANFSSSSSSSFPFN